MEKRFRALRVVASLLKVLAWLILIAGILAAVGIVAISAIQGQMGAPSPVLESVPMASNLVGPLAGVAVAVVVLLGTLLYFLVLYASGDVLHLWLAIEYNTRETAFYLRGESTMPPPPAAVSWSAPESAESDA